MHTIQSVANQTGLTPDVIRVWEKRYRAVAPERTPSNQRLYSETDIKRLQLLKLAISTGRRISAVAKMSNEELESITQSLGQTLNTSLQANDAAHHGIDMHFHKQALEAIMSLDGNHLEVLLLEELQKLGGVAFLSQAVFPLMAEIGNNWQEGRVRTCQEHFGSAHIRTFLAKHMIQANLDNQGPVLILGTVAGCWHEIGAAMAALVAAQIGWQSVYLGANVPPEELAFAAKMKAAKAVALSIAYPSSPTKVAEQLRQVRQSLGNQTAIIAGGASLNLFADILTDIQAHQCPSLPALQEQLNQLRYEPEPEPEPD